MSSIFSFLRRRAETSGTESSDEPTPLEERMPATRRISTIRALMSNSAPDLDQVISDMLSELSKYLPPPEPPLPDPSVSVMSVTERTVGLGNRRGNETRGFFPIVALKGGRLDGVVRFQLWANEPGAVDTAIGELHGRLLAARDELWAAGFLRVAAEETSLAEHISSLSAWRKTTDYRVLYEFRYLDTDGAESLIARIPIAIDSEYGESTIVTNEMIRWDNEAVPELLVCGRFNVGGISALAFVPDTAPSGVITLMRTFDGAVGPPTNYPTLADFLTAVAGQDAPERHGQLTFSSLSDFLAAFSTVGDPVILGDWNEDGMPDSYESLGFSLEPAIQLQGKADRLELTCQGDAFDQVAVVYLRVTQR